VIQHSSGGAVGGADFYVFSGLVILLFLTISVIALGQRIRVYNRTRRRWKERQLKRRAG
jgi:hypothetical protein